MSVASKLQCAATAGSGSTPINITDNDDIEDKDASWPWDNSWIVFVSDRMDGEEDVWMMHPKGANLLQLTDDAADNQNPHFSPDGSKIVYETRQMDGMFEIFQVDLSTGSVVQLTSANRSSESGQYSPDGSKILFKSDRTGV